MYTLFQHRMPPEAWQTRKGASPLSEPPPVPSEMSLHGPLGESAKPPLCADSTVLGLRLPEDAVAPTSNGKLRPGAPVQGRRLRHGGRPARERGTVMCEEAVYVVHVGIDWGSESHQVCVVDRQAQRTQRTAPHTSAGLAALVAELVALSPENPGLIAVAIEVPRGPVVDALLERGLHV